MYNGIALQSATSHYFGQKFSKAYDIKYLNRETGLFRKLAEIDKSGMNISELNQHENIYIHRHFSDAISNATLEKMKTEIKRNIKRNIK